MGKSMLKCGTLLIILQIAVAFDINFWFGMLGVCLLLAAFWYETKAYTEGGEFGEIAVSCNDHIAGIDLPSGRDISAE